MRVARVAFFAALLGSVGCQKNGGPAGSSATATTAAATPTPTAQPAAPVPLGEPVAKMSVAELRRAYYGNEAAADQKWSGKVIDVEVPAAGTGFSRQVRKGPDGRYLLDCTEFIGLAGSNSKAGVWCYAAADAAEGFGSLKADQPCVVRGRVKGKERARRTGSDAEYFVVVEECRVVPK